MKGRENPIQPRLHTAPASVHGASTSPQSIRHGSEKSPGGVGKEAEGTLTTASLNSQHREIVSLSNRTSS
jgi:hypothetical protein